ncbi:MAG: PDZ domain-containing protein [Fidelibacterota bacterium]
MNRKLLISLLTLSLAIGQYKNVIVQKKLVNDDKTDQKTEINIVSEGDQLKVTVNKNSREQEFNVNRKDPESLEKLEDALEDLDLNLETLVMNDDNVFAIHTGGYLGVHIQDLTNQLRSFFKVKKNKGVLISEVVEDSPAEKAGLRAGDVILKVNQKTIEDTDDLQNNIRKYDPDTEVKLTVIRRGREKTISATLGAQDRTFSWIGDMPKTYRKMAFKIGTEDGKENEDEESQYFTPDMRLPGNLKFHMIQSGDDDFEKELKELHKEINELKKEIQKLKKPK